MESSPFKDSRQPPALVGLLDFTKGIAIVWVMLVHAIHGWFGWQGVHVFIVLGGFALTYACLNRENQLTWTQWFRRRAARILPAYWLVAIAGFFVLWFVAVMAPNLKRPFELPAALWRLFADLTLLRNFSYKTMLADPNSALWFIPLIAGFYLVFPWLYSSLAKYRTIKGWLKVLLAAAAIEVIYRAAAIYWLDGMPMGYGHGVVKFLSRPDRALDHISEGFPFQLWVPFGVAPSRIGEFVVGMVGAFALHHHQTKFSRLVLSWRGALCGVVVWVGGNALLFAERWTWAFADLLIAAGVVLWLLPAAAVVQRVLPRVFKAVSYIGVWSYYLFLTHLLFGYAHANLFTLWAGKPVLIVLMLLLTLAAIIGSSWLLWRVDRSGLAKRVFGIHAEPRSSDMSRPKPLFIMGNKRSGTTLVTDLLNSHPNVFVSHEADIAWILFQAKNGRPDHYATHPLDSRLMLDSTLKSCRRILKQTLGNKPGHNEIVETFYRCQNRLMHEYLRPSLKQRLKRIAKIVGKRPTLAKVMRALRQNPELLHKDELAWIGDKKHAQHLDPEVRHFLQQQFPEARYIHVIRHPQSVVASTVEAARTWSETPEYFKGFTEQILEQWAIHEEWVLQAKQHEGSPILTVKLEDLWSDPISVMTDVLDFLGLKMTDSFAELVKEIVYPKDPNLKYASFPLPDVPRARRIMELYSY